MNIGKNKLGVLVVNDMIGWELNVISKINYSSAKTKTYKRNINYYLFGIKIWKEINMERNKLGILINGKD